MDDHPLNERPRRVKVTGYRLLVTALFLSFGVPKAIPSYQGESITPTTLELVFGTIVTPALYWLGFYESIQPPVLLWLFHMDYSLRLQIWQLGFLYGASATYDMYKLASFYRFSGLIVPCGILPALYISVVSLLWLKYPRLEKNDFALFLIMMSVVFLLILAVSPDGNLAKTFTLFGGMLFTFIAGAAAADRRTPGPHLVSTELITCVFGLVTHIFTIVVGQVYRLFRLLGLLCLGTRLLR